MEFAEDTLSDGVSRPVSAGMRQYLRVRRRPALPPLGIPPIYRVKNPFGFMELQDVQELANFFERRVTAYQVASDRGRYFRRRVLRAFVHMALAASTARAAACLDSFGSPSSRVSTCPAVMAPSSKSVFPIDHSASAAPAAMDAVQPLA